MHLDNQSGEYHPYERFPDFQRVMSLAEQGHAIAQYNLGVMYDNGEGVPQDYAEAVKWYQLAAEQGHAKAQNNLGVMYAKGRGVEQDDVLAHMWCNLGAENGNKGGAKGRDKIAKEKQT